MLKVFAAVTGVKPRMWGSSIVRFGEYTYHRANGDEGETMATSFSLRKSGPAIYIMPGYQEYGAIMADLGPHKRGKSCLYLKQLYAVDLDTLKLLISTGLDDLCKTHEVSMR